MSLLRTLMKLFKFRFYIVDDRGGVPEATRAGGSTGGYFSHPNGPSGDGGDGNSDDDIEGSVANAPAPPPVLTDATINRDHGTPTAIDRGGSRAAPAPPPDGTEEVSTVPLVGRDGGVCLGDWGSGANASPPPSCCGDEID